MRRENLNVRSRFLLGGTAWPPLVLFFSLLFLPASVLAGARISEISGGVLYLKAGTSKWLPASNGLGLSAGDQMRAPGGSRAVISFDDGSRVRIAANSSFTLDNADAKSSSLQLGFGALKAWVTKRLGQSFRVRTPTAVCSVRGTEFAVDVTQQGDTSVQMFSGALTVSDSSGQNEVIIRDNQKIEISQKGLGPIQNQAPGPSQTERDKQSLKREVGLEMTKEEVQAAATIEQKNSIYQEGKAIIDVNGNRVRIEEYIIRPRSDQFKLVVLNQRVDRFDYFYYLGTFNQILPDDLSLALRQLPGCIGTACRFFLTDYQTGRSNTADNMLEVASGGHQIDVNNNGVADDAVSAAFDPATDLFVSLTPGTPFYKTLFNNYRITFNGVEHARWAPSGSAPGGNIRNTTTDVAYSYTTIVQEPPDCGPPNCTYTENGVLHQVVYAQDSTGTIWERYDNYIISDEGKIAKTSDFAGIISGTQYKSTLLNWNFQTIVTASEFNGRKIDLAVEPKIFIQSGLIQ